MQCVYELFLFEIGKIYQQTLKRVDDIIIICEHVEH